MAASAYMRGHAIYCNDGGDWHYSDDNTPALDNRACKRCGKYPTAEGHDHCLGTLPGVSAACCGHGTGQPYLKGAPDTWGLDD